MTSESDLLTHQGRTLVMGVVNVTPDSFSDGGRWFDPEAAIAHGEELIAQGADILDIGGESTRPGAAPVTHEQECARILPVIEALSERATISVDTIHAGTARRAVAAGAHIVNDVSGGLHDPAMHATVAELGVPYICQHWRGNPETMDQLTDYPQGVVDGVIAELRQRMDSLEKAGVEHCRIIVDPGLGFAKTHPQSWQLAAATARLGHELDAPVLVGASRKRFLGRALPEHRQSPAERDAATAALTTLVAASGAWAVRVHDVASSRDAVMVAALWKEHCA